jgi:hypothetical protein
MKKAKLDELTARLEQAGFEIVALKDDTYRGADERREEFRSGDALLEDNKPVGTVTVEIKAM